MKKGFFPLFLLIVVFSYSLDTKEIATYIQKSCILNAYDYPYKSCYLDLKAKGVENVLLFGYGSLMDYHSASRTISTQSLETRKPAVAYGVKRIFNRDIDVDQCPGWGIPEDPMARGMLNLVFTSSPDHMVNGIVIQIHINELNSLALRETGYDLIPVLCRDWGFNRLYFAYACMAPNCSPYVHPTILPRPGYFELTKEASNDFGPHFYDFWLDSTYLSDEATTIREWADISLQR